MLSFPDKENGWGQAEVMDSLLMVVFQGCQQLAGHFVDEVVVGHQLGSLSEHLVKAHPRALFKHNETGMAGFSRFRRLSFRFSLFRSLLLPLGSFEFLQRMDGAMVYLPFGREGSGAPGILFQVVLEELVVDKFLFDRDNLVASLAYLHPSQTSQWKLLLVCCSLGFRLDEFFEIHETIIWIFFAKVVFFSENRKRRY